ncbi:ABC-F family ATP-binding cassette domain-containing protein [Segnochrobactrum spirostomi]|uniref:ATP-binding protein Uup n=1 Tax=Segnochrobactrum spirostomi TaxID=2608987 RepID=A0A6A7Y1Q9_9HYPH|nr:ATP-binding cassette domain-containing protein [Segnochrobactrum spirostomi]MQT12685.1 ATP-binding cassette domain-containing protein [Segnochrobactrum spirostomi]
MAPPLLTLQSISLTFGGTPVLDGADLIVGEGERVCLVGRNGSGKSTLLKIAAGIVEADRGDRFLHPGATVRYLPQEPSFEGYTSTLAYVEAGLGPGDDPYRARLLLESLGLTGDEEPDRLSGGEGRRAALARVLAPEPDILFLDEPTNHLDLPAIEWLEGELSGLRSAIVLISHDRRFLERLSRATVWLDRGRTRRHDRGFAFFEAWRDEVYAEEERDRHKLDRKIAMEEDWVRYGVSARRKRNQRRLGLLGEMRDARRTARRAVGEVKLAASESDVSGKLVIEAKDVYKSYGETPIVSGFSTRILRGDRVGIVGPNGAGKTTLVNLITGALAPDSGIIRLGTNLDVVTLDQHRESLDPTAPLTEVLTEGRNDQVIVNGEPRHVVSYMKDFLFSPEQARTPVSVLSGGERGRLMLARALARPSNLLVLDEPTNDLDLETLDLLQEMLGDYGGTVLLISHDRDFIDRVVTSVIAYEGPGVWRDYAGGYSDMVAQRGRGVTMKGVAAAERGAEDKPAAVQAKAEARRKLSFKEKHALETLPKTMAALEKDIATLQTKLSEPNLFARDRAAFEKAATALKAAEGKLAEAEEEWLRLELLKEELEG